MKLLIFIKISYIYEKLFNFTKLFFMKNCLLLCQTAIFIKKMILKGSFVWKLLSFMENIYFYERRHYERWMALNDWFLWKLLFCDKLLIWWKTANFFEKWLFLRKDYFYGKTIFMKSTIYSYEKLLNFIK